MKTALLASSALVLLAAVAPAAAGPLEDLVTAAKAEGELTVIALQHDWCGYGDIIDGFKKKYGLKVNELAPAEVERMHQKVQPVSDKFEAEANAALVADLRDRIAKVRAEHPTRRP